MGASCWELAKHRAASVSSDTDVRIGMLHKLCRSLWWRGCLRNSRAMASPSSCEDGSRLLLVDSDKPLTPSNPMSDSTADELLQEAIHHTRFAFETMERLTAASTESGMGDPIEFRKKILCIRRVEGMPKWKRARLVAVGMKKYSLRCRLDGLRNELQAFLADLTAVAESKKISASDIPFWRNEFYERSWRRCTVSTMNGTTQHNG